MKRLADRIADLPQRKRKLLALRLRAQGNALADHDGAEPIAVIGIGCRFPGKVDGPESLWQRLRDCVDAVKEIPADRWDIDEYYDSNPATPGKMNTRWGGFIDNVDQFDAAFFGISPREARSMDPQQRLLLEVSWEALEDAGQAGKKLAGSPTGVFIGICRNDYGQLHGVMENPGLIDAYFGTGNAASFAAGRLSYVLGLNGPSLAVDTACSSSLVAVHLACQSLHSGECRMALAGGVNLILSPEVNICLSQLRTFAPDGRCKAFDDKADGYVRGEGCGVLVLKKLADALADDDHIFAVIRGSAINQDGRSAGMTAPNGPAQEAVIRNALANAGVDPLAVDFVEAHGTGTSLGDPIEMRAIGEVLGKGREKDKPLVVGSLKSNLGHLEAAAGIAGLIKLVLAIQHGEIPRQLHFNEPSSYIPWRDLLVSVPTKRIPWKHHNKLRLGSVSSFGFSGTNAHVVVEEYEEERAREEETGAGVMSVGRYVLPLSARDEAGLRQLAQKYVVRLQGQEEAGERLRDLCYSAAVRRAHHGRRLALVGTTTAEMRAQLEGYLRGEEVGGLYVGQDAEGAQRGRGSSVGVVFVFSGQGGQWWGMGRELLASEPLFRASLKECAELLAAHTQEWDLWEEWNRSESDTRLASDEIVITQCGLFALQVSLARLWRSYGVDPDAVIGHSLGEVAAAAVAGVLELKEAVRVVYERSRLLRAAQGRGGMAAVELGAVEAEALLAGYEGRVSVAADNGRRASVVSGERELVAAVVAELERQGVMTRELRSSGVGGHSEQVAGVSAELPRVLAGVRGRRSEVALISTVTGREVSGEMDGEYWGRNVRERVRFREGMEALARRGEAVYVEMNAHPVLGLWVREAVAAERGSGGVVIGALRRERGEREVTLAGLAAVYAAGVEVNWETVWRDAGARYVRLPSYPWQRQRFWIDRPEPDHRPQIFSEAEISNDPRLKRVVESVVEKWGRDGALAVNRRYLAPFGFIGTKQESLFYFNLRGNSIVALLYVGPDNQFEPLVQELLHYAEEQGYQLNLIATEGGIGVLERLNFSTTPCGSFQSISDLRSFTLRGNKMRRLRYQVDHYKRQGKCVTTEYKAGSVSSTDREIVEIIDDWVTFKKKKVPFANDLKQDITRGTLDSRLRLFLTYSDETLDSVVLISPAFASGGYLMDLEFYRRDTRPGCLEFAITEIIRQLASEGHCYFSLGGSFGTQLNSHPNANPEVERLFVTLRQEELLNGDGNFQFKNKFRPETSALYLCHPKRYDPTSLSDVLLTLAGEGTDAVTDGPARTLPVNGTSKSRPSVAMNSPGRQLHPLLGEKLQLAMRDVIFQSQYSISSLPFLQDHKIGGVAVLPGTAYVEMGLAAAKAIFGPGPHALLDLSLQQAMIFSDTGAQTIQLVMKSEDNGVASFQILSTPSDELGDSPPWSLHATGTIRVASPSRSVEQGPSIEDIRTRCAEEITGEQYYRLLEEYGFEYGEAFQGVTHVWRSEGEAIAQIQIPESLSAEVGNYRIHPALLDACLQVFEAPIKAERNGQGDVYLLRGAEEISLYVDHPKRVWSHVVLHETSETMSGLFIGDLKLYDDSGQTVAEVRRIYAKRASTDFLLRNTQQRLSDWLYEIKWRPLSREPQPEISDSAQRTWLILSDGNGIGERLQAQLKSKSQHCVIVYAGQKYEVRNGDHIYVNPSNPEDFRRLLEEVSVVMSPGPIGLVNLWSIDSAPQDETVQVIAESIRTSCGGVLYLTQALIDKNLKDLRLWVATRGAQVVEEESYSHEALGQSPLWGLGRVISVEHPEIWGGLIDLDPDDAAIASEQLGEELLRPIDGETQIAYRNGQRYVARLTRSSQSQLNSAPLNFKSGSTYLVTGGLGGLGLECARWMAEHGAKHIALVSRRDLDDELRGKISRIEKTGSQVRIFKADVTDETQVGQVVAEIGKSMPPLRGVVNAAGVLDDGMVHTQTWDQFQRVLDPKVKGSYLLHQHTSAMQLDFFVLFSSAASMFGSVGQANHAAANAFLDALAHYRRGLGWPALSVNWGAWSEIGEAAARNVGERLSAKGIEPLEPEQGWRALEMIFKHSSAQIGVIPIDWKKWKQLYLGTNTPPLMSELMREPASHFTNRAVSRNPQLKQEFSATAPDKRQAFLEAYLARETARVLRMDVSKIASKQPLSELGIDSILTVELRDVIDVDWQVKVPLVEFFREPTIERLASIVLGQLAPTSTTIPTDPAALLAQLDKMSETDVDNLLGVMLAS